MFATTRYTPPRPFALSLHQTSLLKQYESSPFLNQPSFLPKDYKNENKINFFSVLVIFLSWLKTTEEGRKSTLIIYSCQISPCLKTAWEENKTNLISTLGNFFSCLNSSIRKEKTCSASLIFKSHIFLSYLKTPIKIQIIKLTLCSDLHDFFFNVPRYNKRNTRQRNWAVTTYPAGSVPYVPHLSLSAVWGSEHVHNNNSIIKISMF